VKENLASMCVRREIRITTPRPSLDLFQPRSRTHVSWLNSGAREAGGNGKQQRFKRPVLSATQLCDRRGWDSAGKCELDKYGWHSLDSRKARSRTIKKSDLKNPKEG
jgi:hypothetical protein